VTIVKAVRMLMARLRSATGKPVPAVLLAFLLCALAGLGASPASALEPIEVQPDQERIDVTALDEDGDPLRIQVEVEIEETFLRIARDTSLPGFTDGLTSAWEALQQFFGVIVLVAGAAIPFLWVPLLAAGVWWWRKRRESDDD